MADATTVARKGSSARLRPDVQGLRALAVLFVLAFHAGLPTPGGFVGVDVFFVISGFVITAMLLRERKATGKISLLRFYLRRFRRLTPALATVVAVVILFSPLFPLASQDMIATTALGAMFLFANYAIARSTGGYFDPAAEMNPLLHTWSLSVEEQFYLFFPVVLLVSFSLGRRFGRPRLCLGIVVLALGLVSLGVAIASSAGYVFPRIPDVLVSFYGPLGRIWEFTAGAALAVSGSRLPALPRVAATWLGVAGFALLAYCLFGFSDQTTFPGVATLVPVAATVFLIYAGLTPENSTSRWLSARPMVALGNISYSLYLWHWPAIVLATVLWPESAVAPIVAGILALLPAIMSYNLIEQRFRYSAGADRSRTLRLVAVTLMVPLFLTGALSYALNNGFWSPALERMQATQTIHAGGAAGCMTHEPISAATQVNCEWNADGMGAPVYVVGDSTVDHYSEALIGATENLDRPLFMATAPGCPAYKVVLPKPSDGTNVDVTAVDGCSAYIDGTLKWLEQQPPGLVIMGSSDVSEWAPNDLNDPTEIGASSDDPNYDPANYAATTDEKIDALVAGMTSTVRRLQGSGHRVAIAQASPSYRIPAPAWSPGSCSVAKILIEQCATSATVSDIDRVQRPMREAVAVAAARTGAAVLDLRTYFCDEDRCVTQRGELGMYFDDIHISVAASRDLIPTFTDFISARP
jgi:peptidoglycan/LPS O-acetylase OafA/YrhL